MNGAATRCRGGRPGATALLLAGGLAGALAGTLAGCAGADTCEPGGATAPAACFDVDAPPQSVVFQSSRLGAMEIFTMDADGRRVTRLTNNPGIDGGARFSPDGRHIAFSSLRQGAREIWVMNADGSEQRRLTELGVATNLPDWSPDGTRIVFHAARGDGNFDIYAMDANGGNLTRLTSQNSMLRPRWAPDGRRLLVHWYESTVPCPCAGSLPQCPCDGRIGVMNIDGSGLQLLPRVGRDDGFGDWSPDGSRIVFASIGAAVPGQLARGRIMVMNADGSSPRPLTTGPLDEWAPVWSRAVNRIYFVRMFDIYSMRPDGSDVRRLSAANGSDVLVHSR
jgi:TolB protein